MKINSNRQMEGKKVRVKKKTVYGLLDESDIQGQIKNLALGKVMILELFFPSA